MTDLEQSVPTCGAWALATKIAVEEMGETFLAERSRGYREAPERALLWRFRESPLTPPSADRAFVELQLDEDGWLAARVPRGLFQRVIEIGVEPIPFFALELIEAVTLRHVLENRQSFAPDLAAGLALALCRATSELQAMCADDGSRLGMRAGTLSPETIWITARGELRAANPVVEARLRFREIDRRSRPAQFDFLSPEAVRGARLDVEVDVHAIALTLLALLLGRSPFLRASGFDTLMAIREAELAPDALESIGPTLRATLLRALDPDPKKRPPSPSALAEQLQVALDAEGIAPRTDGIEAWVQGLDSTPCGLSPDARPLP